MSYLHKFPCLFTLFRLLEVIFQTKSPSKGAGSAHFATLYLQKPCADFQSVTMYSYLCDIIIDSRNKRAARH